MLDWAICFPVNHSVSAQGMCMFLGVLVSKAICCLYRLYPDFTRNHFLYFCLFIQTDICCIFYWAFIQVIYVPKPVCYQVRRTNTMLWTIVQMENKSKAGLQTLLQVQWLCIVNNATLAYGCQWGNFAKAECCVFSAFNVGVVQKLAGILGSTVHLRTSLVCLF